MSIDFNNSLSVQRDQRDIKDTECFILVRGSSVVRFGLHGQEMNMNVEKIFKFWRLIIIPIIMEIERTKIVIMGCSSLLHPQYGTGVFLH